MLLNLSNLTIFINEENIKYIDLFAKIEKAEQMYGSTGNFGVVWIGFKKRKIFKQLNN